MKSYELTYIISSQIPLVEAENTVKEVESFIQSKEGVILKSEKAVAKTLAYQIKKQSSGYFVVLEFQILENKVKELKEALGKNSKILRHFIAIKKPVKALKARRMRKPLFMEEKPTTEVYKTRKPSFAKASEAKEESVKIEDINKKLDEILSE